MKYLLTILFVFFATSLYAADTKISALPADGTPGTDSLVHTIDDPAGVPANKKTTIGELFSAATDLDANGTLSADCVSTAEMADADHGDVSWAAGVATVENVQCGASCISDAEVDNNITIDLSTLATTLTITDNEATAETNAVLFTSGGALIGGNLGIESDGDYHYNPSTGLVTAPGFAGALTGNVTGNASGSSGSCTGNAATATALAANPTDCGANQFAQSIVASGNLTCAAIADADVPNDITISLAATATALATARNIGGTSFDGTANITPANITVADESADTTCNVGYFTAATGDLPPKTGTNLTFNSSSGVLTATGFAGALTGNVTGDASGSSGSCTGNAATATALAGNGNNCAAGSYPLGIDASGAVESCTDATTEIDAVVNALYYERGFLLENPVAANDNIPFWHPHGAITITDCYCETEGGTSVEVIISDGTNVLETIICDADGQADDGSIANGTFIANERMEFDIGTVTGSVDWVVFTITYTID